MKRMLATLIIVCLLLMSVAVSEETEVADVLEMENYGEEIEFDNDVAIIDDELNVDEMEGIDLSLNIEESQLLDYGTDEMELLYQTVDNNIQTNTNSDFEIDERGSLVKYNGSGGDVVIPDGVVSIGERAFYKCENLTSVSFPNGLLNIEREAFRSCKKLQNVRFSDDLESVGEHAFSLCYSLTNISLPNSLREIGGLGFYACTSLKRISIPQSVINIGEAAFSGCENLTSIDVSGDNSYFSSIDGVLYRNSDMEIISCPGEKSEVDISKDTKSIGELAFGFCNINNITIPSSVTSIGFMAFYSCSRLTSIEIPSSVCRIEAGAFSACTNMLSISVSPNNSWFSSIEGVLYRNADNELVSCPGTKTNVCIPEGIKSIGADAFISCKSLTSVIIPTSVNSIGFAAFENCPYLIIYGESGSYAEKYAKENGIPFKIGSPSTQGITIDQGKAATLYMGNKLTLTTNSKKKLKWKSSKKDVATVSSDGVVTPKKAGTTIITVEAENNNKAQITIKVVDAKSVKISQGQKLTMTIGESLDLEAKITPDEVRTKLTWESSNKKVATVDKKGTVKAIKKGSTSISVKTSNNIKAVIKITVITEVKPEKISLNKKQATLHRNESIQLEATIQPKNVKDKTVKWNSSRPSVATVNSEGVVTALRPGKVKITATSNADKSVKGSCTITVPGKYRALMIGQNNYVYASKLKGCINDANSMKKMIAGLGDNYVVNAVKTDRTADEICQDIYECFGKATDDDVSVFFYSGHGLDNHGGAYQGALCGVDGSYLSTGELAEALGRIRGRVIVIVDACHSGALISTNQNQRKNSVDFDSEHFVQSFICAFEEKGIKDNHAEFRDSKYIVLVAAAFTETSAETIWRKGKFTSALIKGMGCNYSKGTYKGSMPADKNKDNAVTVLELYNYIRKKVWSLVGKQTTGYYADNKEEIMFAH